MNSTDDRELADRLIKEGQYAEALELLERATVKDSKPTELQIRVDLASRLASRGERQAAATLLEDCFLQLRSEGYTALALVVLNRLLLVDPAARRYFNELAGDAPVLSSARETPQPFNKLLAELPPELVSSFTSRWRHHSSEPGDLIVIEGTFGASIFLLVSGQAKVWRCGRDRSPSLVRTLEAGSFFGEISFLGNGVRTATVSASTRCELLELTREHIEELCAWKPDIRDVIARVSGERLASDQRSQV